MLDKRITLEEVLKEIEHIKLNATLEEKSLLNKRFFDPDSTVSCIYGLMTGHCSSERARELCNKTKPSKYEDSNIYTSLEIYLMQDSTKIHHVQIIDYIKGDKKTLTLEDLS